VSTSFGYENDINAKPNNLDRRFRIYRETLSRFFVRRFSAPYCRSHLCQSFRRTINISINYANCVRGAY
ncbi:hypothetical protein ACTMNS_11055, partial [Staphylococcus haemolyticus]